MTNKELSLEFINYLKRKGKAKSTLIAYQNDIQQFTGVIGSKSVTKIVESDLKVIIKEIQKRYELSSKSLSRKLNSIRTFYRFLIEKKTYKR
jgi:integrase/recombinase XerC